MNQMHTFLSKDILITNYRQKMKKKEKIQSLISQNRIENAINELSQFVKNKDIILYDQIILLTNRWNSLKFNNISNIISHDEYQVERSKIISALLNLSSEIDKFDKNNRITRILFLASNPTDTAKRQLSEEFRLVAERLQESGLSDKFDFHHKQAVTADELQDSILTIKPHIVHFSGHGKKQSPGINQLSGDFDTNNSGLIFNNEHGTSKVIKTQALSNMFGLFATDGDLNINTVILNACYSKSQAKAIARHIPFVIGINNSIDDKAALEFSTGFYRGLANHKNIEFCYHLGKNKIELEGIKGGNSVVLFKAS